VRDSLDTETELGNYAVYDPLVAEGNEGGSRGDSVTSD